METNKNIELTQVCSYYSIDVAFVKDLEAYGLIELVKSEEKTFVDEMQLPLMEKYMHFHYDLDINLAGIEAISNLLEKIEGLQAELRKLKYH